MKIFHDHELAEDLIIRFFFQFRLRMRLAKFSCDYCTDNKRQIEILFCINLGYP